MIQTDECADVISRMNEELHTVQERLNETEALLCKIKALILDDGMLTRAYQANNELTNAIGVNYQAFSEFNPHLVEVSYRACSRNSEFLYWCSITRIDVKDLLQQLVL